MLFTTDYYVIIQTIVKKLVIAAMYIGLPRFMIQLVIHLSIVTSILLSEEKRSFQCLFDDEFICGYDQSSSSLQLVQQLDTSSSPTGQC